MPTTKSNSPRSQTTGRSTAARNADTRSTRARSDDSFVARAGRTFRERPYASAAIATGAVATVAGAFFLSRRDQSLRETSDTITHKVKGSFAEARAKFRDLIHSGDGRSQQEIAEEALTLTATGKTKSPVDRSSSNAIKTGAIAY